MIIKAAGSRQMTITERLNLIPVPQVYLTDENYSSSIVSELRSYFVMPKMDFDSFVNWLNEEMGIREITADDWQLSYVRPILLQMQQDGSDQFWKLEDNDSSRMFFEEYNRQGGLLSEEYSDDWIIIGYNPDLDVFSSNSVFLTNVLGYFRGINSEDMQREWKEIYPIRTALAYAMNLDGVLRMYSGYRGIKIMQKIMHTESLIISSQGKQSVTLPKEMYQSFFKMIFNSGEITMDTQYPLTKEDTECWFEFVDANNSAMILSYGSEKLYYGQQGYFELCKVTAQLDSWLKKAGAAD